MKFAKNIYILRTYLGRPCEYPSLLRIERQLSLLDVLNRTKYDVFDQDNGNFDENGYKIALGYGDFVTYRINIEENVLEEAVKTIQKWWMEIYLSPYTAVGKRKLERDYKILFAKLPQN